jgi:hypothetical protein
MVEEGERNAFGGNIVSSAFGEQWLTLRAD